VEIDVLNKKIGLGNDLEYKETELNALISQFEMSNANFPSENIPLTSSTGRIFDVVSYLLGASNIKTYRGEPAMRLEGLASRGNPKEIKLNVEYYRQNGNYIIDTSKLVLDILDLIMNSKNKREDIAAKFQIEFGKILANVAKKLD